MPCGECGDLAKYFITIVNIVEACVAEQLTPRTLNLELRGSSLARRVVSLDRELYFTLSLPSVKMGTGDILLGGKPPSVAE